MRDLRTALMTGIAVASLAALTGCSTWGNKNDGRTAGRIVDDKRLTSQVEDQLKSEPVYKFANVDVKTFNGVVQLSGFVQSEEQKQRAGQLAQNVPGVTRIINSISVTPQAGPTPTGRNTGFSSTNAPASTTPQDQ